MLKYYLLQLILLIVTLLVPQIHCSETIVYGIGNRAKSGDLIEIKEGDSSSFTLRNIKLIGVLSPISGDTYFSQSKSHLNNLIRNKFLKVTILRSQKAKKNEKIGVDFGMVECLEFGPNHQKILNEVMIQNGYAHYNSEEATELLEQELMKYYKDLEGKAKSEKLGLWSDNAEKEVVKDATMDQELIDVQIKEPENQDL